MEAKDIKRFFNANWCELTRIFQFHIPHLAAPQFNEGRALLFGKNGTFTFSHL